MLEKFLSLLNSRKETDQPAIDQPEGGLAELEKSLAVETRPADAPSDARKIDTSAAPHDAVVTSLLDIETNGIPSDARELRLRFISRQPVLDRSQRIVGYELLLRNKPLPAAKKPDETLSLMYDQMLVKSIIDLGAEQLLRGKQAFISVSAAMLEQPLIERLPRDGVVLGVRPQPENLDRLLARCHELKSMGYRLALEDFAYSAKILPLVKISDYLRFDISRADVLELGKQLVEILKTAVRPLIALGVESEEHFEVCRQLSFQYFEGYYFAQRQPSAPQRFSNQRAKVVELLNLVREHAEIRELEESFKRDAALTFKLLCYINSPANGLAQQIRSIAHGLTLLGHDQLYRWLTLLLFSGEKGDIYCQALLKNALVRARLAELLGRDKLSAADRDGLFIVGILSMIDALLNMPMESALSHFNLPHAVSMALLRREGIYAPYLELAVACEKFDQERIAQLAEGCGLDADVVNIAHIKALIWAEEIEQ